MSAFYNFSTTDPHVFETAIAPLAGDLKVRPAKSSSFKSEVDVKSLRRLAIFTVRADSIKVRIAPPHRYVGLHMPLGRKLAVTENRRKASFGQDVHLLKPDRELSLEARNGCRVLVTNVYAEPLQDYALKLTSSDTPIYHRAGNRITLASPAGLLLIESLANLWSELYQYEINPGSRIGIEEAEDGLLAGFVAANEATQGSGLRTAGRVSARTVARAEEYLIAHLTRPVARADLAAFAGVSIRSLSRGFYKRHGTGPMAFLKTRRMTAAYRELLGAKAESTTVRRVATRYGINHLGKFSLDFKRMFGESPSVTLTH